MFEAFNADDIFSSSLSLSKFMNHLMAIRKVLALADKKEMFNQTLSIYFLDLILTSQHRWPSKFAPWSNGNELQLTEFRWLWRVTQAANASS